MTSPIILNGMELDPYLQIPDLDTSAGAVGNEQLTLGGTFHIQRMVNPSIAQMTLTAVRDGSNIYGRFLRAQVQVMRALADSGEIVPFVYHSLSVEVVLALNGIQMEMIGRRTDPPADHPYVGTVLLLRV